MEKECKIDECEKGGRLRRGLCNTHYKAWRAENNPNRCSFEGCDKGVVGKGLCDRHYQAWRREHNSERCSFEDCEKRAYGKGLCNGHWQQQRAGKELTPLREMPWSWGATLAEKIKAAEEVAKRTPLGCLVWPACRASDGYGYVWCSEYGGLRAHRAAYLVHKGELPKDLPLHHTCGKGSEGCFAIEHLVPVTQAENTAEMMARTYYEVSLAGLKSEIAMLRAYLEDMDLRDDFDDFVDSITVEDLPEDLREELTT